MAGALSRYAFINAKIRARISKFISDETFRQMIKVRSLEDAVGLLRDTELAAIEETYRKTGDLKLGELGLLKNELGIYKNIERHVNNEVLGVVRALLLRFEIDNLKNAVRLYFDRKVRHRSIDAKVHYILYDKIVHNIGIDAIVNAGNFGDIIQSLEDTPYGTIMERHQESVEQNGTLFYLEIALDHFYYRNLIESAGKLDITDRRETLRLVGFEIDLQNINWIIRLKNFYKLSFEQAFTHLIPGGFNLGSESMREVFSIQNLPSILGDMVKRGYPGLSTLVASAKGSDSTSKLLLVERVLSQIMQHEVQKILAGYPFTIGILLSYFILKRNEIKKVITILNAKMYNLDEESIEGIW